MRAIVGAILFAVLVLALAEATGVADVGWPWEEGTKLQRWLDDARDAVDGASP